MERTPLVEHIGAIALRSVQLKDHQNVTLDTVRFNKPADDISYASHIRWTLRAKNLIG